MTFLIKSWLFILITLPIASSQIGYEIEWHADLFAFEGTEPIKVAIKNIIFKHEGWLVTNDDPHNKGRGVDCPEVKKLGIKGGGNCYPSVIEYKNEGVLKIDPKAIATSFHNLMLIHWKMIIGQCDDISNENPCIVVFEDKTRQVSKKTKDNKWVKVADVVNWVLVITSSCLSQLKPQINLDVTLEDVFTSDARFYKLIFDSIRRDVNFDNDVINSLVFNQKNELHHYYLRLWVWIAKIWLSLARSLNKNVLSPNTKFDMCDLKTKLGLNFQQKMDVDASALDKKYTNDKKYGFMWAKTKKVIKNYQDVLKIFLDQDDESILLKREKSNNFFDKNPELLKRQSTLNVIKNADERRLEIWQELLKPFSNAANCQWVSRDVTIIPVKADGRMVMESRHEVMSYCYVLTNINDNKIDIDDVAVKCYNDLVGE